MIKNFIKILEFWPKSDRLRLKSNITRRWGFIPSSSSTRTQNFKKIAAAVFENPETQGHGRMFAQKDLCLMMRLKKV